MSTFNRSAPARRAAPSASINWRGPISTQGVTWLIAAVGLVLMLAACSGSADATTSDATATEDLVASGIATQQAIETQISEGVAATAAAQQGNQALATATVEIQPTVTAEPPGPTPTVAPPTPTEDVPSPTATQAPPAPTATSPAPPPAPTATPHPPTATPTPAPPTPTPTPELPERLVIERPDQGYHDVRGAHGSFAQASASFDTRSYPARTQLRSAVYFGIGESIDSEGVLFNLFQATHTGEVAVTVDVSWNGVLTTFGLGDMTSTFRASLGVQNIAGGEIAKPVDLGFVAFINPNEPRKIINGSRSLRLTGEVIEGGQYGIYLTAICHSEGSRNGLASDTECIFDNTTGEGGYVEWSNLSVEYLP